MYGCPIAMTIKPPSHLLEMTKQSLQLLVLVVFSLHSTMAKNYVVDMCYDKQYFYPPYFFNSELPQVLQLLMMHVIHMILNCIEFAKGELLLQHQRLIVQA